MAINLWRVNTDAIGQPSKQQGRGQSAFNNMVDGGPDGEFYQETTSTTHGFAHG